MIKVLKKVGIEGMFLNIGHIQQTYRQHHSKWRTTETIPIKVRNNIGMSDSFTLIQMSFGITARIISQEQEIKRIQIGKKSNYPYLQMTYYYT
jgi:hypothetical protein